MGRLLGTLLIALALLLPAAVSAQPAPSSPGEIGLAGDGRLFGHLTYPEVAAVDLAPVPYGFSAGGGCQQVNRDILPDLERMLAAAGAAGVGSSLRGTSCFRSIERQRVLFCGSRGRGGCQDPAQRAVYSAPSGHSEHATGYTIDFVAVGSGCAPVRPCIAATTVGRWLLAHGPEYGFELSFPDRNTQGVTYEPWHWRWVGATADEPGAARARALFAPARTRFPAFPAVRDGGIIAPAPPPAPMPGFSGDALMTPPVPALPMQTVPLPYPSTTPPTTPMPDPLPAPGDPVGLPGPNAPARSPEE